MRTLNIIVTGFEPFGGESVNASWEAVKKLQDVQTVLLPVSFRRAVSMIREIVSSHPDAVICVGEAGGRNRISVERVAVNLMDDSKVHITLKRDAAVSVEVPGNGAVVLSFKA